MPPKVAAITMVYNEAALLPVWARHYVKQVGADHCYVIDHGSTDALVLPRGVNQLRLPRSPHDDLRRAGFISKLTTSLLAYYDWVIYTDVDELLVADPAGSKTFQVSAPLCQRTIPSLRSDLTSSTSPPSNQTSICPNRSEVSATGRDSPVPCASRC